jgi:uncharacterized protein (TIRG00374 family)
MTSNTSVPLADALPEPRAGREEETAVVIPPTLLASAKDTHPEGIVRARAVAEAKLVVAQRAYRSLVNRRSHAEAVARKRRIAGRPEPAVAVVAAIGPAVATTLWGVLAHAARALVQPRPALPKRLIFSLALFVVLFKAVSWHSVLSALRHANPVVALLGFAVGMCGVAVSCLQWQSLLTADGIFIRFGRLVKLCLIGIAFNHFPPTSRGGDAVKALYVGRESRNPAASASAVVMTRITGFLGMMLVAVPGILLLPGRHWRVALAFALLTVLVGGMIAGAFYAATSLDWLKRSRFDGNFPVKKAIKFARALRASSRPRTVWTATAFGIYLWITGCLNYAAFGVALGLSVPLYLYFIAIPLSSLVTYLPISFGGYGVREGVLTLAFTSMGVAAPTALALALLVDIQTLLFALAGGVLYQLPMTHQTPHVQLSPPPQMGRVATWQ